MVAADATADPIPDDVWGLLTRALRGWARGHEDRATLAGMTPDDLFQSAALAVVAKWRERDRSLPRRAVVKWLLARARGEMLDQLRAKGIYSRVQLREVLGGRGWRLVTLTARKSDPAGRRWTRQLADPKAADPADESQRLDLDERFRAAVRDTGAGLVEHDLAVLHGMYVEGRPQKDVAASLGLSPSRVSQLHSDFLGRARAALSAT